MTTVGLPPEEPESEEQRADLRKLAQAMAGNTALAALAKLIWERNAPMSFDARVQATLEELRLHLAEDKVATLERIKGL